MSNWQEPVAFLHPAVLLFGEVTMRWYLTEELNKRCPKTTNEAKTTALTPGDLTYLLIRRISRHQWDDKEMGTMPARIVILTLFRGYINDLLFATTISRSGWIVVCNIFMGEDLLAMMGAITRNYKHAIIMKKIENAPRKNNIKNHLWSLKSCRKNSICHEKKTSRRPRHTWPSNEYATNKRRGHINSAHKSSLATDIYQHRSRILKKSRRRIFFKARLSRFFPSQRTPPWPWNDFEY